MPIGIRHHSQRSQPDWMRFAASDLRLAGRICTGLKGAESDFLRHAGVWHGAILLIVKMVCLLDDFNKKHLSRWEPHGPGRPITEMIPPWWIGCKWLAGQK